MKVIEIKLKAMNLMTTWTVSEVGNMRPVEKL